MWRTLSLIVKSICNNLSRWKIHIRKTVLVYNKTKRTYSKKMHSVAIYTATWPCQNWFLFQIRKKKYNIENIIYYWRWCLSSIQLYGIFKKLSWSSIFHCQILFICNIAKCGQTKMTVFSLGHYHRIVYLLKKIIKW